MNPDDILKQLDHIFADVVGGEPVGFSRTTTAEDVDEWDSINHIQFIVAIEKHFKIRFTRAEINAWNSVGDMCDAIAAKKETP